MYNATMNRNNTEIKAAFLDRDGTINVEKGYLHRPEEVELIDGAAEAVRRLNEAGYTVFGVSNQSGVARGFHEEKDVELVNRRVIEMVKDKGGEIKEILYCPHHPDGIVEEFAKACGCRKPAGGMVEEAKSRHGFTFSESIVIGDKAVDVELGRALGAKTALVLTGYGKSEKAKIEDEGKVTPDYYASDLADAVDYFLGRNSP